MGREVRRVPLDWEHPVDRNAYPYRGGNKWDWTGKGRHFVPLFDKPLSQAQREWDEAKVRWDAGVDRPDYAADMTFEEYEGERPTEGYRPEWPAGAALGYQLYETVTEGTPLSPVFSTPEGLAGFLVGIRYFDNEADALHFVGVGWAPSFIATAEKGLRPGYEVV